MQVNVNKNFVDVFKAIDRWHSRTAPDYRSIDNLISYLQRNNYPEPLRNYKDGHGRIKSLQLKSRKRKKENVEKDKKDSQKFLQLLSFRSLADYLQVKNLNLKLTPRLVDSVLRPKINYPDLQWGAYQFFLEHFHEHPNIEHMVRESIGSPLRLRVEPVYPADGNLAAYLFDPRKMKTYTFSRNPRQHWKTENTSAKKEKGKLKSISSYSVLEEYKGKEAPFSKEYKKRVKDFLKGEREIERKEKSKK